MRLDIVAAALMFTVTPAMAAETIVGTWAPDPTACTPVGGMLDIGPRSLTTDILACRFDDVSRDGDRVTWHGRCSEGEERYPATVVAALYQHRLTVSLNGHGWLMAYRRCR